MKKMTKIILGIGAIASVGIIASTSTISCTSSNYVGQAQQMPNSVFYTNNITNSQKAVFQSVANSIADWFNDGGVYKYNILTNCPSDAASMAYALKQVKDYWNKNEFGIGHTYEQQLTWTINNIFPTFFASVTPGYSYYNEKQDLSTLNILIDGKKYSIMPTTFNQNSNFTPVVNNTIINTSSSFLYYYPEFSYQFNTSSYNETWKLLSSVVSNLNVSSSITNNGDGTETITFPTIGTIFKSTPNPNDNYVTFYVQYWGVTSTVPVTIQLD